MRLVCEVMLPRAFHRLPLNAVNMSSFSETFHRLVTARDQSRSAKSVEVFGWLILLEGTLVVLFPHLVARILHLPPLVEQAANYFRLVGLLVSGVGMLYIASGRLNAAGFVFASLLDRPLVPFAMAVLWYLQIIPGPLALIFSLQDFGSFLWTLTTWRAESPDRH
jgi:Na+-driven multidrug efflux pump